MSRPVLLFVDDDRQYRESRCRWLRSHYVVRVASSPEEARASLFPPPDVILLDLRLRGGDSTDRSGVELLQEIAARLPNIPVLMITGYGDLQTAVDCMREGAVDFLDKSTTNEEIRIRLVRAVEHGHLRQRMMQLERDLSVFEPGLLVGDSSAIRNIRQLIDAVSRDGYVSVLIRGETGTGKELVARSIHASGRRKSAPFVPILLASLPESMLEVELFGHESGAFTDAKEQRTGYLEKAHRGVLFLDEMADVDPGVQVKLLRMLEEREFQRLGSTVSRPLDIQIVAATNADLRSRVQEGRFREDLYFRLQGYEIVLPPLRERLEDIPLLAEHFLNLFAEQGKRTRPLSKRVLDVLGEYSWPGNVRQMRNALESALIRAQISGHDQIEADDLPADLHLPVSSQARTTSPKPIWEGVPVDEALRRVELACIDDALRATGGRKSETWRRLGYHDRETLYRRVRRILRDSPSLAEEYPNVQEAFKGMP